jgi:hypothetical protein
VKSITALPIDRFEYRFVTRRFFAVTQPIKYSKHKNSNRVYVMLALTWVISITISSPIALGMNYTERRAKTPTLCTFYNSDFLIYSSMGSFYIPCIVMTLLYWRIFHAIRQRARKSKAASASASLGCNLNQRKKSGGRSSAQPSAAEPEVVIVNRPPPTVMAAASPASPTTHLYVPPPPQFTTATSETEDNSSTPRHHLLSSIRRQQQTGSNVADCHMTTCVDDTDADGGIYDGGVYDGGVYDGGGTTDVNSGGETVAAANESASDRKQLRGPENGAGGRLRVSGYCAPTSIIVENCTADELEVAASALTQPNHCSNLTSPSSGLPIASILAGSGKPETTRNGGGHAESAGRAVGVTLLTLKSRPTAASAETGRAVGGRKSAAPSGSGQRRFVTRFTFGLKKPVGKKTEQQKQRSGAHNAQRRERKATKTLAIVLGECSRDV